MADEHEDISTDYEEEELEGERAVVDVGGTPCASWHATINGPRGRSGVAPAGGWVGGLGLHSTAQTHARMHALALQGQWQPILPPCMDVQSMQPMHASARACG